MSARMKIRFDNQKKSRRNQGQRLRLSKLALLISAALLVACVVLLVRYGLQTRSARRLQQEVQAVYAESAPLVAASAPESAALPDPAPLAAAQAEIAEPLPPAPPAAQSAASSPVVGERFLSLYAKNKDLAGWLKSDAVPEIDFPVVQRDNDYYLYRDFYGRQNMAGTVFLDQSVGIQPLSQNLVLHGHNMKNGTMFGKLYQYLDIHRLRNSPMIEFSTLYDSALYVPYAVSLVSVDATSPRYVSLVHPAFSSGDELIAYADTLRGMSAFSLPMDVQADDHLLTLITCHGDEQHERLVVALRALRAGENAEELKSLFRQLGS